MQKIPQKSLDGQKRKLRQANQYANIQDKTLSRKRQQTETNRDISSNHPRDESNKYQPPQEADHSPTIQVICKKRKNLRNPRNPRDKGKIQAIRM